MMRCSRLTCGSSVLLNVFYRITVLAACVSIWVIYVHARPAMLLTVDVWQCTAHLVVPCYCACSVCKHLCYLCTCTPCSVTCVTHGRREFLHALKRAASLRFECVLYSNVSCTDHELCALVVGVRTSVTTIFIRNNMIDRISYLCMSLSRAMCHVN